MITDTALVIACFRLDGEIARALNELDVLAAMLEAERTEAPRFEVARSYSPFSTA